MGKVIDEFLSTPIPAEVWHYTTVAGFQGILASGRVWATEAHFTTDETEFVHAREVAQRFLAKLDPQCESTARAKQAAVDTLAHAFDQGPLSPSKTEIFVASFCATEDLKSQWMEYGDSGHGVSLAFDLRHVRPPKDIGSAVTFAPCLYRTEDKERMLADALADWESTVTDLHQKTKSKQWAEEQLRNWTMVDGIYGIPFDKQALLKSNEEHFHEQLHASLTRTSFDLLRIASHCKDHAFHQEAEWRLSLPHTKGAPMKDVQILHRGPNNAIPYIAHSLFCKGLPITRVKVGPLTGSTEPIEAFLNNYGCYVPVTKSRIPLRATASIKGNSL
jgi:hypothetical protein